jgi:uncharacterized protein (TIGR03437 family)
METQYGVGPYVEIVKLMRLALLILIISIAVVGPAAAQTPVADTSGNGLLSGTYYFRDVVYGLADSSGDIGTAGVMYGNISFSGTGTWTISSGTELDSQNNQLQTVNESGTYAIGASGYGYITHPLLSGQKIYGTVSNGIFIGSATEGTQYNDLFVSALESSPVATNSSFQGTYSMAGFFPSGTATSIEDASFTLNPNGAGSLGNFSVTGYSVGGGTATVTQNLSNIKYAFSNGGANLEFPNSTSSTAYFFFENEYLYISADGNFVFGGDPNGYDFFVGVKTQAGTAQNLSGLYYQAGLDENGGELDTYWGAFNATSSGNIIGHQRFYDPLNTSNAYSFTYPDTYPASITGTYTGGDGTTQYTVGRNGTIRIGFGTSPALGISVALSAPVLSGSGVFLNPQGVVDAASEAPFTAGVSPGQFITLYGTGLAPSLQVNTSFPTMLNGVQVLVDGIPAPLYYVSATQIAAIVPYSANTFTLARFQVVNNGSTSNSVIENVNLTTPGVFTFSANGLGDGAIEHADGSFVTESNPAQPGETVAAFMSGLGAVFPPVTAGTLGPASPLSYTTNMIAGYIGGNLATVYNSEGILAPYLTGLYQVNITIPTTATAGDNAFEILGPDSDTVEATIPVGGATAADRAAVKPQAHKRPKRSSAPFVPSPAPCFVTNPACQS